MRGKQNSSTVWLIVAASILGALVLASLLAPTDVSIPVLANKFLGPWDSPPLGTDDRGIPYHEYALQGAGIVTVPTLLSGVVVALLAVVAGLSRCAELGWFDTLLQWFSEMVGSLPRFVVILVVALVLPNSWKAYGLYPIAITWAFLAAPGAMDEAAATAGRLGGARFVEALRAHGFSASRIYLYHITWLNLRGVIVRQAAEVMMQVVFLEIALSYLSESRGDPHLTHSESVYSWATLLYQGYAGLVNAFLCDSDVCIDRNMLLFALLWGLLLVALTASMAQAARLAARAR